MNLEYLNPLIRSVSNYEVINRKEECVGYDSRSLYIVSGDVSAVVGGKKLGHLSAGHLVFIPAGVPYKLKGQYLSMVVVCFDPTYDMPEPRERISPVPSGEFDPAKCHLTVECEPFDRVIHLEDFEAERDNLLRMSNIFTSAEGHYLAQLSAMLKLLLIKIAETVDEHALPARMVEELDGYIRDNVGDEISNTEIGAIFGYHPFYVSRVLKERKGITLRQYIISYRLKAAKRALEVTAKSIAEIAEETGFTDASYFTKTFRQTFGMTPKEYRNKFKEEFI